MKSFKEHTLIEDHPGLDARQQAALRAWFAPPPLSLRISSVWMFAAMFSIADLLALVFWPGAVVREVQARVFAYLWLAANLHLSAWWLGRKNRQSRQARAPGTPKDFRP